MLFPFISLFLLCTSRMNMATSESPGDTTSGDGTNDGNYYVLNDGNKLPKVGLGVYRADPGKETYRSVQWALKVGYRLIDTAAMYGNEHDVGQAILDSGIPRTEIFITTKLNTDSHGYHTALQAANECLAKLQTTYIDLLLIHSPYGEKIVETWDALLALQKEGKAKSIGVSNFGIPHLEALREHHRPMPAVNQFEMHPLIFKSRHELIEYCQQHQILITAYGSLFSGERNRFRDPFLQELAQKYSKTVPQILLRWALDNGFAVIPKSTSSKERLEENWNVLDFSLSNEEVRQISQMPGEPLDEYWDPVNNAEVDLGDLDLSEDTHHWG